MLTANELRTAMQGATSISDEVLTHIYKTKALQIWVPKVYGGLGYNFKTGLTALYEWARIDGSLGWMLTLCSGANYFSRNMLPELAKTLFSEEQTCFGGSGMVGGTAEEQPDGRFLLQGLWHYATGAPYLSHFTLNAKVCKNGKPILDNQGKPRIRSFLVERSNVQIIPNWKSMGMKATGTFSFEVNAIVVPAAYQFNYDTFYTEDAITQIPFRLFADLTLLVNYLGIAYHFMEEAEKGLTHLILQVYKNSIADDLETVLKQADEIEFLLTSNQVVSLSFQDDIHKFGVNLVESLTQKISKVHRDLGIKGTQVDQPIHQIFCDFFTAILHVNFKPNESENAI